jgi:hypothetical protein
VVVLSLAEDSPLSLVSADPPLDVLAMVDVVSGATLFLMARGTNALAGRRDSGAKRGGGIT